MHALMLIAVAQIIVAMHFQSLYVTGGVHTAFWGCQVIFGCLRMLACYLLPLWQS